MTVNLESMPTWVHVVRLMITFLIAAACGVHAFSSYKQHVLTAKRWIFLLYSIVFLLTTVGMFAYLIIALKMQDYSRGPFSFGYSSVLLILSYLAITYGAGKRHYDWNANGQEYSS